MSVVVADQTEPAEEDSFTSSNLLTYVPGVLLLIAIGLLGKYAQVWWNSLAKHEHWTVPDIEYVLWAIVFGLLVTNTVGLHRLFRPGVQTYESWLKIGCLLLARCTGVSARADQSGACAPSSATARASRA